MNLPLTIFLCGMPGSGKSSLGTLLASKIGYQFIDLDKEIENATGKTVTQLFSEKGEDHFRKKEQEILHALLQQDLNNVVISLGGGTVAFFDNLDRIKQNGTVIYLQTKLSVLIERLKNDTTRPLLNNEDLSTKLNQLLVQREPYYTKANKVIQMEEIKEKNVQEVLNALQMP